MIESLFIIGAVIMSLSGFDDLNSCETIHRDFIEFHGVEKGIMSFDWKDNPIKIQVLTQGELPDILVIPVGYTTPIDNCVPKI